MVAAGPGPDRQLSLVSSELIFFQDLIFIF